MTRYTATLTHRIGSGTDEAEYARKDDAVAFIGRTFNEVEHADATITSPSGRTVWTLAEDGEGVVTFYGDDNPADVDLPADDGDVTDVEVTEDGRMIVTRSHDPRPGQTVPYTVPQEHDPRLEGVVQAAPPTGKVRAARIPAGSIDWVCEDCGERKPVQKFPTTRDKSRRTQCRECRDAARG